MPNEFENILSHSFNMPKTIGEATSNLSQLLLKEENGQKLSVDETRRKIYLMMLVQEMIKKKNIRTNITEYYNNSKRNANTMKNMNNLKNIFNNRRKSRRTKKAKRFYNDNN